MQKYGNRYSYFLCVLFLFLISVHLNAINIRYCLRQGKNLLCDPRKFFMSREESIVKDSHVREVAHIRCGNELHPGEQEYLANRMINVQHALEKMMHVSLYDKHIPKITVVASGGGYRAMLGTIGALSGLQKIGVLDMVTYISTLSGSTWALGTWLSTGMTLSQLKKYISQQLTVGLRSLKKGDGKLIARMLATKILFNQPCTTVDLFGALLAHHLLKGHFGKKCQMIHLSDQIERIKHGNVPFPIYTAIDGRTNYIGKAPWYEFTPFEIGSAYYALYVPTWAYGRRFLNGKSVNYAPEQSLGFHFGVFGSAYGAHVGLAWERVVSDALPWFLRSICKGALQQGKIHRLRVSWAKIPNYMRGFVNDELRTWRNMRLVDAGIECNLPYQAVSGERPDRKSDLFIFFDFSKRDVTVALQKVEAYAQRKDLKFPRIDYAKIHERTCSIFKDDTDPTIPTVIFMPRISDKKLWNEKKQESRFKKYHRIDNFDFGQCAQDGFCDTLNFCYTLHESRQVMDQMEFNVVANEQYIIDAIRVVVASKNEKNDTDEIH